MTDKPRAEVLTDEADGPDFSEPIYDAGDPAQVNLKRRQAGRKAKEKRSFIAQVMADPAGRAWLHELLSVANTFGAPVVPGDPYMTHFRLGEQNLGHRIMADIMRAAPELYVTMIEEANAA